MDGRQRVLEARAIMREIDVEYIAARNARQIQLCKDLLARGKTPPAELYRSIDRDLETAELIRFKGLDLRDAQARVSEAHRYHREHR